jgi:hypothetical protein
MSANKLMQDFESKLKQELEAVVFPKEAIQPLYLEYKRLAIANISIMKLACDVDTYKKLISDEDQDLFSISFGINAIENSSPFSLELQTDEYLALIKQTRQMASVWNDLVMPIKEKVSQEIQPKPAPSMKGNMKVVPPNRKR